MVKKISTRSLNGLFSILSIVFLLSTFSCREEFTEEDALDALRQMDIVFYVYDKSSTNYKPVPDAEITILQGKTELVQLTDSLGVAVFNKLQLGRIFYRISADNFLDRSAEYTLYNEGGLINEQTMTIGLFNLNDESLATVKGRVLIETDLTNDDTEFAEGVPLNLRVQVEDEYLDFLTVTDNEGKYEFRVPAENYGSYTVMRIPDLEWPQRIAYNRIAGDERSFPEIVPTAEDVMTIFSTNTSANRNESNYPVENVVPYYAIAETAPKPENTAIISSVYTDGNGAIAGLSIGYGGDYTGDADGNVRVTVYSLAGGSGAYFDFSIDVEFTNLYDIYYYGNYTMSGGSGYPHDEYYLNRMSYRYPTPQTSDSREKYLGNIVPGSTTIINIDYGTGTYRLYDYD